jgi:dTMP kinase
MGRGKLIVVEGLDGSGKSTQVELVKKYLEDNLIKYQFFHFPMYGHNEFSEVIAKFLRGEFGGVDDVDPYFVGNIYAMDRFKFLPDLAKALEENDVVLLDRYVFSNLAYQGAKLEGLDSEKIKNWIYDLEFGFLQLPYPDLSIFFDVPMDVVHQRLLSKREGTDRDYLQGKQDIHEADIGFQTRVRENYLSLVGSNNYKIIQCATKLPPSVDVQLCSGEGEWIIFPPSDLFRYYKSLLDHVIYNQEESRVLTDS